MVVLIFGGRDYHNKRKLFSFMDNYHRRHGLTRVIVGGARGADTLAEQWADSRGISKTVFPADWSKYGRRAGMIRNQQMLAEGKPDIGIAFPGGTGTRNMATRLQKAGKKVIHIES